MGISMSIVVLSALWGAEQPAEAAAVREFRIQVADEVLDDLRQRLARTRWPDQIAGSEWEYDVDRESMKELVEYWRERYDWRKHERHGQRLSD